MKHLFILPEYHREQAGGIRTFYCNLLPALAKAGCSVKVLLACRGTFDSPSYTDAAGVEVEYLRGDLFEKHSRNVAVSYLAGQPTLGHYLPVGLAAHEQARGGEGFDLVELTDWPLYFLPWVCLGAKAPFTISLHSSIGQMRDFEPMPGWEMETHFIRLLEAAAFAAAPAVHTNSNLNARYWEGITNRKVDVLLPLMANLNTKDTNTHERGEKFGALSKELAGEAGLITEITELVARARLAGQAGASEPDSLASELAESLVSESLTRSASSTASSPATSYPLPNTAPEVPLLDSGHSPLDSAPLATSHSLHATVPTALPIDPAPRLRGAVFARLQNLKGAEVLLEALRLVPEVCVDWYGRSVPSADGKRAYAEELQVKFPDVFGRQLLHHGVVAHEQALAAMRNAAFVCVPSLWDVFNLTVIEAMAQGCVVICSTKAGAEMLIKDGINGFLCDPSDSTILANALRKVHVMEQSELDAMGKRAAETIQSRFNPIRLVEERIAYYQQISTEGASKLANPFLRSLLKLPYVAEVKRKNISQAIISRMVNFLQKI